MGFSTSVIPVNLTGRYKVSIFWAVMPLTEKTILGRERRRRRRSSKEECEEVKPLFTCCLSKVNRQWLLLSSCNPCYIAVLCWAELGDAAGRRKSGVQDACDPSWTLWTPTSFFPIGFSYAFLFASPSRSCPRSDWSVALYLVPDLKVKGLADIFVMSAIQTYEGDRIQEPNELIGRSGVKWGERPT